MDIKGDFKIVSSFIKGFRKQPQRKYCELVTIYLFLWLPCCYGQPQPSTVFSLWGKNDPNLNFSHNINILYSDKDGDKEF